MVVKCRLISSESLSDIFMTYKSYLLLCFICLSDLIYLLSHFIKNYLKIILKENKESNYFIIFQRKLYMEKMQTI